MALSLSPVQTTEYREPDSSIDIMTAHIVLDWLHLRGVQKLEAFDRLVEKGINMEEIAKLHESKYLRDEDFEMAKLEFGPTLVSFNTYKDAQKRAEEMGQTPPARTIPVTDPDFVPEGFHENCRDELGAIKVTKKNHHLYQDNEHLVHMFKSGLWACEEGVTYTTHEAQCPEGRVPTIDSMNSLAFRVDITFKGRIVCEEGKVFDADTMNFVNELQKNPCHPRVNTIGPTFQKAMEFHMHHRDQAPPPSIKVSQKQSDAFGIPVGEYILKKRCWKKGEDGVAMFSICDSPDCCLMNHIMLEASASNMMDPQSKRMTVDYFKERTMYKVEDNVNGNFDICQMCLTECVRE